MVNNNPYFEIRERKENFHTKALHLQLRNFISVLRLVLQRSVSASIKFKRLGWLDGLKLQHMSGSLGACWNSGCSASPPQVLIGWVQKRAFLTNSRMMLVRLVVGLHFESHWVGSALIAHPSLKYDEIVCDFFSERVQVRKWTISFINSFI